MRRCYFILAIVGLCCVALADDDTLDWLMKTHGTTAPTTAPTQSPATRKSPLQRAVRQDEGAVSGTVTLSNGRQLAGRITTTPDKPLRAWVEEKHEYVDLELSEIATMTANIVWERDEQEWHFIASGSDVKEYTGRTYPARETTYTFALNDGRTVTGGVVAPIYVQTDAGEQMLVLNKRSKGPVGQKVADLIYIQKIVFSAQNRP